MTIDWLMTKDFNEQSRLSLHAVGSCYFRHSETVMNLYSAVSSYIRTMNMNKNIVYSNVFFSFCLTRNQSMGEHKEAPLTAAISKIAISPSTRISEA